MEVITWLTWNHRKYAANLRSLLNMDMEKAGEMVAEEIRRTMREDPKTGRVYRRRGVTWRASAPGQSPAIRFGEYIKQIEHEEQAGVNEIVTRVGSNAMTEDGYPLSLMLELGTNKAVGPMKPRPHLRPSMMAMSVSIWEMIQGDIGRIEYL